MRRPVILGSVWFGRALLLLALVATSPLGADAQAGQTAPEIEKVIFEGNETFPDDSLARAIVTQETQCRSPFVIVACWAKFGFSIAEEFLRPNEIPRDALRLRIYYQRQGFRETLVDTATAYDEDGKVTVSFLINEGRPVVVSDVAVVGIEDLEDENVTADLPISAGDRLSTIVLDATIDSIQTRLRNGGYAYAEALRSWRIQNDDRYSAEVTFDVLPGPRSQYGTITVAGNAELSAETVRRTLQFREGDLYRAAQLRQAQGRLFGLDIIRNAQVTPDLGSGQDSIIDVTVTVAEGDVHRVRGGTGWSSAECLSAEGRWTSRNFLGGARTLQARGRIGNVLAAQSGDKLCWDSGEAPFNQLTWLAAVDFRQPWIFSTRNSFQAGLFGERQSVPDVFVREAIGLNVALTRAIGPRTPLVLSYRPELSRLDAAEFLFCTSFLVCRPTDIEVLQGANWLAPAVASLTRTTTDNIFDPSRGYTVNLNLEHASGLTGSNFRYDRVESTGTYYTQPTDGGLVLALRARGGWVSAGVFDQLLGAGGDSVRVVHPQKRFYSGGANSVRGYGENRLGPKVLSLRPVDIGLLFAPVGGDTNGAGCTPQQLVALTCDASELDATKFTVRPTGGTTVVEANAEARVPFGLNFQMAGFVDAGRIFQRGGQGSSWVISPGVGARYMSPIGPVRLDVAYRFEAASMLQVVTTQIRPFNPLGGDDPDSRIGFELNGDTVRIPWVRSDQLAILDPLVRFEDSGSFLRKFQLHLSLGQAF